MVFISYYIAKGFKNKKMAKGKKRTEDFEMIILILEQCENIRTKKISLG